MNQTAQREKRVLSKVRETFLAIFLVGLSGLFPPDGNPADNSRLSLEGRAARSRAAKTMVALVLLALVDLVDQVLQVM